MEKSKNENSDLEMTINVKWVLKLFAKFSKYADTDFLIGDYVKAIFSNISFNFSFTPAK
jgi:predicted Zn-dependent protease